MADEDERLPLTEISNAAVALHREVFGRGPRSAKTFVSGDLVVCVLNDVFTSAEKSLIEAGHESKVREARAILGEAADKEYLRRMEPVIGRAVEAHIAGLEVSRNLGFDLFLLSG